MRRTVLIEARKNKKLSRELVSRELNISTVYLRKLENGTSKPGRDLMVRMENYYGLSVRELFPDIFLPFKDTDCSGDE